ncbi:MAG: histidine phosphatase family protein [Candidatus Thorarchaeota archaeon]
MCIVRHGQSVDNITKTISGPDTPLSDLGREQAKSLGKKLLDTKIKFDAVYSSTFLRASETATLICNEIGVKDIVFEKRFREGDAGIYTGRRGDDLTKEEKEFLDSLLVNVDEKPPGGESVTEQRIRHTEAFLEIVKSHPETSTILIVGHGGTLYHILKNALDILPEMNEWFGNCQLNIIESYSSTSAWKLTMLNNTKLGE